MADTWKIDDALPLIRALQPITRRFNYHLALGGGVLNKGYSNKDLDLFFLPLDNKTDQPDPNGLKAYLDSRWGEGQDLFKEYSKEYSPKHKTSRTYYNSNDTLVADVKFNDGYTMIGATNLEIAIYEERLIQKLIKEKEEEDKDRQKKRYHSKLKYDFFGLRIDVFIFA